VWGIEEHHQEGHSRTGERNIKIGREEGERNPGRVDVISLKKELSQKKILKKPVIKKKDTEGSEKDVHD